MGAPVDPLRFRANIAVEGWEAWQRRTWSGTRLTIGGAQLRVLKTIDRCPATHVDPVTGFRDLDVMQTLQGAFGRISCGVYASVKIGGAVAAARRGQRRGMKKGAEAPCPQSRAGCSPRGAAVSPSPSAPGRRRRRRGRRWKPTPSS